MNQIINFFWNSRERRIRALYRITIEIFAYILIAELPLGAIFRNFVDFPDRLDGMTPLWVILVIAFFRFVRLITVPIFGRLLDKRPLSQMGLNYSREWWKDLVFGLALGAIAMIGIFVVELLLGWVTISDTYFVLLPERSFYIALATFFVLLVIAGVSEELFYRSYILTNICEGLNFSNKPKRAIILALILSSAIFGLTHVFNDGATLVSTLNIMFAGILLSIAYILTGRIALSIGLHITWNFFQGNVFGFAVSGNTFLKDAVTFYSVEQGGPDAWTGGAFGPEAGLLGLIAMILSIGVILGYIYLGTGKLQVHTALALPPAEKESNP